MVPKHLVHLRVNSLATRTPTIDYNTDQHLTVCAHLAQRSALSFSKSITGFYGFLSVGYSTNIHQETQCDIPRANK